MLGLGIEAVKIAFMEQLVTLDNGDTVAIVVLEDLIKRLLLTSGGSEKLFTELGLRRAWQGNNIPLTRNHNGVEWRADILEGPLAHGVIAKIMHGNLGVARWWHTLHGF